jgi:iron complex transport system substrate-binding protein
MTSYRHSDDKNYFHSYFGSSCHSHYDGCYYSGYRYNGYRYFVRHLCAMILVASFLGCGGESSSEHRGHLPDGPWLTVTDGLGRQVEFPHPPKRVVSLAPKNTELMFAIGAGEQLVGATTYCNYPPPSRQLPKVGGFSPSSVSLETLIDLQPDMVLSAGDLQRGLIDQIEQLGVPVVALNAESLETLYEEIDLLGRITQRDQEAERCVREMRDRVARVRRRVAAVPMQRRVTVFYRVWEEPLTAAGPDSYLGQLIELAGGKNIMDDASSRYVKLSEEVLLERNPDVIIAPSMGASVVRREELLERSTWREIRAVQRGAVHVLDGDLVSRCGPRLVDALEVVAGHLYPELISVDEQLPSGESNGPGGVP